MTSGDPGPTPASDAVSAQMRRMPRKDSKPELILRRELHARGLRFTVNRRDLPGTPDVVLSRARLAVFVDGCFWHSCPEHGVLPKNNRDWWRAKLDGNIERDHRKDDELRDRGWVALHAWEHEPVVNLADRVERLWRERTGRTVDALKPPPAGPAWHPGGR